MIQPDVQPEVEIDAPVADPAPAAPLPAVESSGASDPSLTPVTSGKSAMVDVWLAAGGLIVVLVVGGVLLSRVRKKTLGSPGAMDEAETVMQMIKRLHASGEMSDEEYQATRKKLLGTMARQFKESGAKGKSGAGGKGTRHESRGHDDGNEHGGV